MGVCSRYGQSREIIKWSIKPDFVRGDSILTEYSFYSSFLWNYFYKWPAFCNVNILFIISSSMNLFVRSIVPRCRIQAGIPVKPPMSLEKQRRTITSMFGVSFLYLLVEIVFEYFARCLLTKLKQLFVKVCYHGYLSLNWIGASAVTL